MRLVCITEAWWMKYVDICFHRKAPQPWPTRRGLFVAEGDDLVAGVCIYDTDGPHLFFEHLVTNETAPLKLRHAAVTLMAREMMQYSRVVNKLPHILVRHKGIEKILKSVGLVPSGAWSLTCPFPLLEGKNEDPKPAKKHPRLKSNPAAPVGVPTGDAEDDSGVHVEVPGGGEPDEV